MESQWRQGVSGGCLQSPCKQEAIKEYHPYGKGISGYQEEEELRWKIPGEALVMVIDIPLEGILSCFDLSISQGETEILNGRIEFQFGGKE